MYYIQKSTTENSITTYHYYDGISWSTNFYSKKEYENSSECDTIISDAGEDPDWTDVEIKSI
tara:strand:- start:7 stop:192 length:186 start_codon:yes stop_codon:yes gene_type:complete